MDIFHRRNKQRQLNSLMFTLSVVENYWENETNYEKKSTIWQNVNSIFTHFKVLKYFLQKSSFKNVD